MSPNPSPDEVVAADDDWAAAEALEATDTTAEETLEAAAETTADATEATEATGAGV